MPMHDWTRVDAGIFHDFHNSWITHLQERLNAGLLPSTFYALGELRTDEIVSDMLTPSANEVQISQEALDDLEYYLSKQRTVVIHHATGDRVVALIEIVSPANKHTQQTLEQFADKVIAALHDGIHVLIIDPFPPKANDPHGIHGYIWHRLLAGSYEAPREQPLTLVSYAAGHPLRAYVEPLQVAADLAAMPLFLTRGHYINVPLEETYLETWAGVPGRWRRVIEGNAASAGSGDPRTT
ncbi:MAG: hypothetical protein WD851_17985 [Pirellulales bacterium]